MVAYMKYTQDNLFSQFFKLFLSKLNNQKALQTNTKNLTCTDFVLSSSKLC